MPYCDMLGIAAQSVGIVRHYCTGSSYTDLEYHKWDLPPHLINERRHLEAHGQHALLPLQAHVLGPLDKSVQVSLWGRSSTQACNKNEERLTHSDAQTPK